MVLRMVKVLRKATKNQIADKMGVSPDYAEYLCKQMVIGGYLSHQDMGPAIPLAGGLIDSQSL